MAQTQRGKNSSERRVFSVAATRSTALWITCSARTNQDTDEAPLLGTRSTIGQPPFPRVATPRIPGSRYTPSMARNDVIAVRDTDDIDIHEEKGGRHAELILTDAVVEERAEGGRGRRPKKPVTPSIRLHLYKGRANAAASLPLVSSGLPT